MMSKLKTIRKAAPRSIGRMVGTSALALGALACATTPVLAQGANAPLNIPANPVMFGKNDPNVRRATAIVNGEIVAAEQGRGAGEGALAWIDCWDRAVWVLNLYVVCT